MKMWCLFKRWFRRDSDEQDGHNWLPVALKELKEYELQQEKREQEEQKKQKNGQDGLRAESPRGGSRTMSNPESST